MSETQGALDGLAQLQRQVSGADIRSLIALRGEVGAVIAATATATQQASSTASALVNVRTLQEARDNARAATNDFMRDYFDSRKFDRYLRFASREDEEQYRRDEEYHRREIEKALAEGTPEGDLRAALLARKQLLAAGAHGADRSPEYGALLMSLETGHKRLKNEIGSDPEKKPDNALAQSESQAEVPADVLASIRAAKIEMAEPGEGHGVSTVPVQRSSPQRG